MKYLVDKKKFTLLLRARPALLRTVVNLTEEFCKTCFYKEKDERCWSAKFSEIYLEIPSELKTLAVTREYLKTNYSELSIIPLDILTKFTKHERHKCLENNIHNIEILPNPTYEEWLLVLSHSYHEYKNIPMDMWTQEMALEVARHNGDRGFDFEFPEALWDQAFAIQMVTASSSMLNVVPTDLINNEVLQHCLNRDLDKLEIPESAWDQATVEKAVELLSYNIQYVPKQYITEKINLIAASKGISFSLLTIKTYPILVAYVANNNCDGNKDSIIKAVNKIKDKETFILDVLKTQEDNRPTGIFNLDFEISEELWLKILKNEPSWIIKIDRCNQTPAMVDAFLNSASADQIDRYALSINLGKIKAHHAPLLIGCENNLIQEIRNKFLKANAVNTVTDTLMEIDLAPSEYAKIKGDV
ncbi:MAG: hypothetical protein NT096_00260 [Proteobacteria bacterium]|nr:hypothetical protein [Pseudomonadota bacterium]